MRNRANLLSIIALMLLVVTFSLGNHPVSAQDKPESTPDPSDVYDKAMVLVSGNPFTGSISQNDITLSDNPTDTAKLMITGGISDGNTVNFGSTVMYLGVASTDTAFVATPNDIAIINTKGGVSLVKNGAYSTDSGALVLPPEITLFSYKAANDCLLGFKDGLDEPVGIKLVGNTGKGDNVALQYVDCPVTAQDEAAFIKFIADGHGVHPSDLTGPFSAEDVLAKAPAFVTEKPIESNGFKLNMTTLTAFTWTAGITANAPVEVNSRILRIDTNDSTKRGMMMAQNKLWTLDLSGTSLVQLNSNVRSGNSLANGTTIYKFADPAPGVELSDCVFTFVEGTLLPQTQKIEYNGGYVLTPTACAEVPHDVVVDYFNWLLDKHNVTAPMMVKTGG